MFHHISVLLQETIDGLNIKEDGIYVDCTLGGGGHSQEILKRLTTGHLYCFDQDQTAIAAALGLGFYGQLAVFVVASVLSIFFVRPKLCKLLHGKRRERPSNADALMGRIGRVSEAIEQDGYGRVAIDGDDWKAVSADGSYMPLGQNVRVVGRESIIITVEKA